MKTFWNNFKYNFKRFFKNMYVNAYGMDDINKILLYGALIMSIANLFLKNQIFYFVYLIVFAIYLFRFFSRNKFQRAAENRKFRHIKRYFELKKQYRSSHNVYMCKKCGQFIKIPKGVGKVETTCPSCGSKETHRS